MSTWILLVLLNVPVSLLLWPMLLPGRPAVLRIPLFVALCVVLLFAEHWLLVHQLRLMLP